MGIQEKVLVCYHPLASNHNDSWSASTTTAKKYLILVPPAAESVFLEKKESDPQFFLFKGCLEHELGHISYFIKHEKEKLKSAHPRQRRWLDGPCRLKDGNLYLVYLQPKIFHIRQHLLAHEYI